MPIWWQELIAACARHQIKWEWVKGHAGHPENERADRLASDAANASRALIRRQPDLPFPRRHFGKTRTGRIAAAR